MTTISAHTLRLQMPDVMSRLKYKDEKFAVTKHGKVIAHLTPANAATVATATENKPDAK